jgi:hypothetical protein
MEKEVMPSWVRDMLLVPVEVVKRTVPEACAEGLARSLEVSFMTTAFEWLHLMDLLSASGPLKMSFEARDG